MRVLQHRQPQPLHLATPARGVPIVLVVPRHVELAEPRGEPAERRDFVSEVGDEPVGHVPREGHHIRVERVGCRHHPLHEAALQRRANVQVRQLHDAEPFEVRRQVRDGHAHPHHVRPARAEHADDGQRRGDAEHRVRPHGQADQIHDREPDDQQRGEAQHREPDPPQRRPQRPAPPQDEGGDRQPRQRQRAGPGEDPADPDGAGGEVRTDVDVQQRPHAEHDGDANAHLPGSHRSSRAERGTVSPSAARASFTCRVASSCDANTWRTIPSPSITNVARPGINPRVFSTPNNLRT